MNKLLKPTRLTWIIFGIISILLILNLLILNIFDVGIEALVIFPYYLTIVSFEFLGLDLTSQVHEGYPIPNLLGYILILMTNIIVVFFISLLVSKLVCRKSR